MALSTVDRLIDPGEMSRNQAAGEREPTELLHPQIDGGVFLPEAFRVKPGTQGLESIEVIDTKKRGAVGEEDVFERTHYLMAAVIDGKKHVWWYSPANQRKTNADNLVVVNKPGLGEIIEKGVGWIHHKQISRQMPNADVVTHATYGFGPLGENLSWEDLRDHGKRQFIEHEERFLKVFFPTSPLLLIGVSLGSIENHGVTANNLSGSGRLNIQGVVEYAHANVDPRRVPIDMILRFTPHMIVDGVQEAILRTKPWHIVGTLMILGSSGPRFRDTIFALRQGLSILSGTPEEEQREVIRNIPKAVISGDLDPLLQRTTLEGIQRDFPDSLVLEFLRKRGHGIAFKPFEGGKLIADGAVRIGQHVGPANLSTAGTS